MDEKSSIKKDITQEEGLCQVPDSLPFKWGTAPVKRLGVLYAKILRSKIGTEPTLAWGKMGKIFKALLTGATEIQVASLLIAHFNYNPTKNGNEWLQKTLKENAYPIELFQKNINVYKSYLIFDRQVEYDDVDNLKGIVYKYISRLTF